MKPVDRFAQNRTLDGRVMHKRVRQDTPYPLDSKSKCGCEACKAPVGERPMRARIDFWQFVAPMMDDRGCWEWTGPVNDSGYGRVGGKARAHRTSYEMHKGPVPPGLFVLHTCDNKTCVNPSHLYVGTKSDNAKDAWARGQLHHFQEYLASRTFPDDCPKGHREWGSFKRKNGEVNRYCLECNRAKYHARVAAENTVYLPNGVSAVLTPPKGQT